jgi:hypothetical protein
VDATVNYFKTKGFVCTERNVMVDPRIGRDLAAVMLACPILGGRKQGSSGAAVPVFFLYEPAL